MNLRSLGFKFRLSHYRIIHPITFRRMSFQQSHQLHRSNHQDPAETFKTLDTVNVRIVRIYMLLRLIILVPMKEIQVEARHITEVGEEVQVVAAALFMVVLTMVLIVAEDRIVGVVGVDAA
jgi:hypothetical protein